MSAELFIQPFQREAAGVHQLYSTARNEVYTRVVSMATANCVLPASNENLPNPSSLFDEQFGDHLMSRWEEMGIDRISGGIAWARIHLKSENGSEDRPQFRVISGVTDPGDAEEPKNLTEILSGLAYVMDGRHRTRLEVYGNDIDHQRHLIPVATKLSLDLAEVFRFVPPTA